MRGNTTGIQVEKPVSPWERPGCFRLDCEPHRGGFLRWMSFVSFVLACFAPIPYSCVLALPAIPPSFTVWCLCRRDLAQMLRGLIDPTGYEKTQQARKHSLAALIMIVCGCGLW